MLLLLEWGGGHWAPLTVGKICYCDQGSLGVVARGPQNQWTGPAYTLPRFVRLGRIIQRPRYFRFLVNISHK
jgi:hypothetical protein